MATDLPAFGPVTSVPDAGGIATGNMAVSMTDCALFRCLVFVSHGQPSANGIYREELVCLSAIVNRQSTACKQFLAVTEKSGKCPIGEQYNVVSDSPDLVRQSQLSPEIFHATIPLDSLATSTWKLQIDNMIGFPSALGDNVINFQVLFHVMIGTAAPYSALGAIWMLKPSFRAWD